VALKASIYKVDLNISDMDRHYYAEHQLTIAKHPSETDIRMMVRILAFARHASDRLQFTKGLSQNDEPELWQKSLSDEIELWIDLGQPDEKRLRKASGRARRVLIYTYQQSLAKQWLMQYQDKLNSFSNIEIVSIADAEAQALTILLKRSMQLQCTIQDGGLWLGDEEAMLEVAVVSRQ